MSNGQSIPDDDPLDAALEAEEVLRRLIDYDEALAAGLSVSIDGDETLEKLNPDTRRQVAEIGEFLEFLNNARRSQETRTAPPVAEFFLDDAGEVSQAHPASGSSIGRFSVVRELGRGGYGIVFLAVDPSLDRKIAVKIPRPETLISRSARQRFIAEGRAIASLNHPNILSVYEVGETGAVYYIASEYCAGPTLQQWLREHPSGTPPQVAARVLAELADAVEHAHARGILHRDLKPANVLLQPTGGDDNGARAAVGTDSGGGKLPFTVKLSDFGIAKIFEEAHDRTRTMTGTIVGTAPYLSPEQAAGKNSLLGPASDVYGLGAILYELLVGKCPFDGESREATIRLILNEEPIRPRAMKGEIPRDVEAICLKCLEKEPRGRYATAAELGDDLRRFLAGGPVSARPLTVTRRLFRWGRRRPASAALVLLAALSFIGFALGGWWHSLRLQREIEKSNEARVRAGLEHERANVGFAAVREQSLEIERQRQAVDERANRVRRHDFCLDAPSAYRALTGGRPDRAVAILQKYRRDAVASSFAWRFLWRLCHREERAWSEPGMECNSVAFSPDGRRLAAGFENGTAPVWDLSSGKEALRLRGHTSCVNTVRFTPDGKRLATASCDGSVRLWDAGSGRQLRVLLQQKGEVNSLALSPDGSVLASGDFAAHVTLFRLPGGEPFARASLPGGRVDGLAFSADGKRLAVAAGRLVRLCRVAPGLPLLAEGSESKAAGSHAPDIHAAVFAPGGSILAWAGASGVVHLGDSRLVAGIEPELPCRDSITSLVFDRSGRRLLCAGDSRIVEVWDIESGRRLTEFYGHTNRITDVALCPDERLAATAGREGTVRLWSMEEPADSKVVPLLAGADKMEFAAEGSLLIVGGGGTVRAFDTAAWQEQFAFDAERFAVSVGPAGDFLATYGNRRCIVRSSRSKQELGSFLFEPGEAILDLALSADGRHVVAAVGSELKHGDFRLSDQPRSAFWNVGKQGARYRSISMSPRGSSLAGSISRPFVVLQGEFLGRPRQRIEPRGLTGVIRQIRYSPDARFFAGASDDHAVYLWNSETNQLVASLIGHAAAVNCVAFSPDGKTLASGDDAGIARLWDLDSQQEALQLKAHARAVQSIAFSPDGRLLITATAYAPQNAGEVRIWFADGPRK